MGIKKTCFLEHQGVVEPIAISNKYYTKWLNKEKIVIKNEVFFYKFLNIYEGKENKDVNDESNSKPMDDKMQELLEKYPQHSKEEFIARSRRRFMLCQTSCILVLNHAATTKISRP